jgi:hypothetical protein
VLADVGSVMGGWLSSHFIKKGWAVNPARKVTLLICALCILPVMFVTQIHTQFDVNPQFFQRIGTATYTRETIQTVDGKAKSIKTKEPVPADAVAAMHTLDGKHYDSAKEFLKDATAALGKNAEGTDRAKLMEQALLRSARTDNLYWLAVVLIALGAAGHQAWSANLFTLVSDVFPKKAIASVTGIGGMVGAVAGIVADFSLGKVLSSSGPSGYFFAFLAAGSAYLILLGVAHVLMPRMTPLDENLNHVART